VVTPYPGAGSSDVLEQVTLPIERAISSVPRLELIQSTSSNSVSLVVTQFSFGTDVPKTTAAIQDALNKAGCPTRPSRRSRRSTSTPPGRRLVDRRDQPGRPRGRGDDRAREIVPEIAAIEGVARADLTGGLETRLAITLDPTKLAAAKSPPTRSSACSRPTT
jgi:HAE1 family hydrophobic/amphiphilic exporter-1